MSFPFLYSVGRQAWHEFQYYGKKALDRVLQTPLPRLLVLFLALWLMVILLPLVVGLFVFFVLLKIALTLLAVAVRSYRKRPQQIHHQ